MQKQELDLGLSGGLWKQEYESDLIRAILNCFNDGFPFYLNSTEIYEQLIKVYKVKQYKGKERKKCGIIERIKKLRDEEIYPNPFVLDSVLVLPEWFSYDKVHTINGRECDIDKVLNKKWFSKMFCSEDDSKTKHTISQVCLKQYEDGFVFFSFPRILYADYSPVFEAIYSQKDFKERMNVIENPKHPKYIELSLDSNRGNNNVLRLSAFFLLDYIIGYLASGVTKVTDGQINKLSKALSKLKWLGYKPNDDMIKKIRNNNINTRKNEGKGEDLIEIVYDIFKRNRDNSREKLILPEYSFSTTCLFELYSFSVLKTIYPDLEFKPQLHEPLSREDKRKRGRREPDMVDNKEKIVFDPKYKYEYGHIPYCDINSVNRMARYLLLIKNSCDWFDNYFGCFVYPDMTGVMLNEGIKQIAEKAKKDVKKMINEQITIEGTSEKATTRAILAKIGLPFPVRKKYTKNHN